jgi:hypothetical protein
MAAGLGFKDFTTGEVLTAADVDGYLMQGIWVFASNAARDAAVTAPAEGNFAFTKDTNSLWYYDGAAWVASGATGDIEGVTAGVGISGGGTSGTVTVTNSMATAIDAKGDLIAGTGADTFDKLTVGANDTVLTADSSTATGLKWAAPAGGVTFSGTRVFGSANISIANETFTVLTYNSESYDTDAYHSTSTNTGRITIPAGKTGYYFVWANTVFAAATGRRIVLLEKNGSDNMLEVDMTGTASNDTFIWGGAAIYLTAGDYMQVKVWQSTGGNLNAKFGDLGSSNFGAYYLGA